MYITLCRYYICLSYIFISCLHIYEAPSFLWTLTLRLSVRRTTTPRVRIDVCTWHYLTNDDNDTTAPGVDITACITHILSLMQSNSITALLYLTTSLFSPVMAHTQTSLPPPLMTLAPTNFAIAKIYILQHK